MSALPVESPVVPMPRPERDAVVLPFPDRRAPARAGRGTAPHRGARRTPAPALRITRRGRLTVTSGVLAALLGLLGVVVAGSALAGGDPAAEPTSTVVVMPGDTLWEIAAAVPGSGDVRDVMAEIRDLNALPHSGVLAGQTLVVPAER